MAYDIVEKVRGIFDDVVAAKQSELRALDSAIHASTLRLKELEEMEKKARDQVAGLTDQAAGADKIVKDAQAEARRTKTDAEALARRIVGEANQSAENIAKKAGSALAQLKQALEIK